MSGGGGDLGLKLFYAITGMGHSAVLIFFALSGYLVGGTMLSRMLAGQFSALDYWSRRMVRLWIVVLPALALTGSLDGIAHLIAGPSAYDGSLSNQIVSLPKADSLVL